MPTFSDLLGPPPESKGPGTFSDLLGPPPEQAMAEQQSFAGAPLSGTDMDHYFGTGAAGRVMDAVGQGAKEGWGASSFGMDPTTEQTFKDAGIFNDVQKDQHSIIRAFNEALIRPAAAAIDFAVRAGSAAVRGYQGGVAQLGEEVGAPQLGRDLAALPEAFPTGQELQGPRIPSRQELLGRELGAQLSKGIEDAAALKVIGAGEDGWKGIDEPDYGIKGIKPELDTREPINVEATPLKPDIHAVARQIAPEVFNEYDTLTAQRDALRAKIDQQFTEARQSIEAQHSDSIAALEDRMEDATPRLQKKYQARIDEMRADIEAQQSQLRDTPAMTEARKQLMEADYRMRDLAPDVTAAYAEAAKQFPETNPEAAAPEPAAQEAAPAAVEPPAPEPKEEAPPAKVVPSYDIAGDVSQKLQAAGRPAKEADAAGALLAAHYQARADRFNGALGSAEELYKAEGPEIKAGRQRAKEYAQEAKGKIRVGQARATITLMKSADASTFIHETGHQWLEELMRDATDKRAPSDLVSDAETVRDWLGNKGGNITTRQHEQFARGFERYMMEGRAPTQGLAGVFQQFKEWLTTIYETVTRLKAPITKDIRDVFDRLLTTNPERATIAPDFEEPPADRPTMKASVQVTSDLADLHETDAKETPPEQAAAAAEQVKDERTETEKTHAPELAGASSGSDQGGAGGSGKVPGSGASKPNAGGAANSAKSEQVGAGGDRSAPEGNRAPPDAGPTADVSDKATDFRTKKDAEVEKVANIRLDKINTPDDMTAALRQIAAANDDFMEARTGPEAYRMARDIADTRTLLRMATSEMMEAAKKAAEGDPAAISDWVTKQQRAAMVFRHLSNLSAEWGHAGHALNKVMEGWGETQMLAKQIQETTGKTLFQLQEEAAAMAAMETAEQAGKFASDMEMTRGQKIKAGIISYFINNLISGPLTHMAYSVGNTTTALFKAGVESPIAGAIGSVRGGERAYMGEAGAQLYGMVRGVRDGVVPAMSAIKSGIPFMKGLGEEAGAGVRSQSIPGKVGYALETPSRIVAGIHTLFYSMGYEQEIARLAFRQAMKAGLDGAEFDAEVARLTGSPSAEMMNAAHAEALKMVLMERPSPGSFRSDMAKHVNSSLPAKIIMPFMQIGTNILKEGLVERTPLALLSADARADLSGARGSVARDLRLSKIAAGSMLGAATVGLAMEGLITGGGPSDPDKRRVLEDTGWKPYSIKWGDTYIPYRKYLGFLGPLVAASADMHEIGGQLEKGDLAGAAGAITFGFSEVVADETWMQGLSNFIDAARHWDTKGGTYFRNLATSFIPFSVGLQQTARLVDPYQRQARTLLDGVRNKIPGVSQQLAPQIGIWGQPITAHTMLSPGQARVDPVDERLKALDMGVTMPERKVRGVELTDQQYAEFAQKAGMLAHMQLTAMVSAPGFAQMPDTSQIKAIKDTIASARETARTLILMQNPDIVKQAIDAKQARITGAK